MSLASRRRFCPLPRCRDGAPPPLHFQALSLRDGSFLHVNSARSRRTVFIIETVVGHWVPTAWAFRVVTSCDLEYLGFVVSHQPTLPCRQKSGAETTVVVRSVSRRLARCSNRSSSVSPVPSVAESSERWSSSGAGSLNGVSFPLFRPRPVRAVSIHTCLAQPPTRGCSTSKVVPRAIFYRCWGTCVNF